MATTFNQGIKLSHTGAQVDSALTSEEATQVATTAAMVAAAPPTSKIAVVPGSGLWAWVEGDETTPDNTYVLASTVSDYADAGRWKLIAARTDGVLVFQPSTSAASADVNATALQAAADLAFSEGRTLYVFGDGYLSGITVNLKCSTIFSGTFKRGTGASDLYMFKVIRDESSVSIANTGLSATELVRGSSKITALASYRDHTVTIVSTEVDIDSTDLGNYVKKHTCVVVNDAGDILPPLPFDVADKTTLTVTAYPPERPVIIDGLTVETEASSSFANPVLGIERSGVTVNSPRMYRTGTDDDQGYAIRISDAVDVTINQPRIESFQTSSLGYGITINQSSFVTVNDPSILNCKHTLTGRNSDSVIVRGGILDSDIDTHWGQNYQIEGCTIRGVVRFAGANVTIRDCTFVDADGLLLFREDTPEIRGSVVIENCRIVNSDNTTSVRIIGYPNASLSDTFIRRLVNPQRTVIRNLHYSGPAVVIHAIHAVHGNSATGRQYNQTLWGDVLVENLTSDTAAFDLVLAKHSDYHELVESWTTWADATAYALGDNVIHSGVYYTCAEAHTSATAADAPGTGSTWDDKWFVTPSPTITLRNLDFTRNVASGFTPLDIKTFGDDRNDTFGWTLHIENCKNVHGDISEDALVGESTIDRCTFQNDNDLRGQTSTAWQTATAYTIATSFVTQSDVLYMCTESHTSGTFSTDLAANKWRAVNLSQITITNSRFDDFYFTQWSWLRVFGCQFYGALTSNGNIELRILQTGYNYVDSGASGVASRFAHTGFDRSDWPKVAIHVGEGTQGAYSGGTYTGLPEIVKSTTTDEEVAIGLNVEDGTKNRRAKFFIDGPNAIWGLWMKYSSSRPPFVIGEGTTEWFRLEPTVATFPAEVKITGALNHDGSTVGFYGTTPATQASAIADATDAASTQSGLNSVLAALRAVGIIAT